MVTVTTKSWWPVTEKQFGDFNVGDGDGDREKVDDFKVNVSVTVTKRHLVTLMYVTMTVTQKGLTY